MAVSESSRRSPAVSIVVPSRIGGRTLDSCLQSLDEQDFPKDRIEVIVVDSGGQEARDVCDKYRVTYIQRPGSRSPGEARNAGLETAKGDVVVFIDADCVAPKDWLKRIERDFEDFPMIVGVLGFYQGGKNTWQRIWNEEFGSSDREVGHFKSFMEGNTAFKREIFERGFRFGVYRRSEGWVLMSQLNKAGYLTLRDRSLRVLHTGFPYTSKKIFETGRLYVYNSRTYFGDLGRARAFSTFLIASLPCLALLSVSPLFLAPFLAANSLFAGFVLRTHRVPLKYVAAMFVPLLAARWVHWFGFIYESLLEATGRRGIT